MTAAVSFRQDDITRACKGIAKAGLQVARAEIDPDGTIRIIIGDGESAEPGASNPLDEQLYGPKT